MIRSVEIAGFQSLRRVRINVGKFTVISGPSNSGKTAFIRALDLLAFNVRGTGYITRGEKACSVTMIGDELELTGMDDEPWTVVVHRTAAGKGDQYKLHFIQMGQGETQTFTKLAGKVPDQVARVLRISPLHFARQFDRPYLLDASGGDVARVLGSLTNVTTVLRAAGEAERRRRATLGELRTRRGDLDRLVEQARQYENLPQQKNAVETAELAVRHAGEYQARLTQLENILKLHAGAQAQLALVRMPAEPPSLARLEQLAAATTRLSELITLVQGTHQAAAAAEVRVSQSTGIEQAAKRELDDYMAQWGVCPTCGQRIHITTGKSLAIGDLMQLLHHTRPIPFRAGRQSSESPMAAAELVKIGQPDLGIDFTLLADASEFQPQIADALYAAWSKAIVIRAMYGDQHDDNAWYGGQRREFLHGAGIQFLGIYQYLVADQDPVAQAEALVHLLGAMHPGERIICDVEEGSGNQNARWNAWRSVIEDSLGDKPWIYSGEYFAAAHGIAPVNWVAAYGVVEPPEQHVLWQFTDQYTIPGIGVCDCSVYHGPVEALAALAWQPAPQTWTFPVPHNLRVARQTGSGYTLTWDGVAGPSGQVPVSYSVYTWDSLNARLVNHQDNVTRLTAAEYGPTGRGLPAGVYHTNVWANGGPLAPPHATVGVSLTH